MTVSSLDRYLFAHLVDYAGTFPPASLSIGDAVMTSVIAGMDALPSYGL